MKNIDKNYNSYFDKFIGMKPYLYIDEKEWKHIKDTFDKETVKYSLAKVALTYPLPYRDITKKEAQKHFSNLKKVKWPNLLKSGAWKARESADSYKYPLTFENNSLSRYDDNSHQTYITLSSMGNSASDYFHQVNRWAVDAASHPGPQRTWGDMKFMITLMGAAYSLKLTKINKLNLRLMIAMRKYICSQFKPSVAKCIYDMYEPKNILDFSAGWGDRLVGFYASSHSKFYLGIDPNESNHISYNEQVKFYEKRSIVPSSNVFQFETKTAKFICQPAEDYDYKGYDNFFDMCFTSPPYFDKERYSHNDTQSWKRYKNIDLWNKNFLHCALNKVWKTLKKGGLLLVNISDVYSFDKRNNKKQWLSICDPMNDFISTFQGSEYVGCLGMQMAKRPNNTSKLGTVFCEPIWVWKKGR